MRRVNLLLIAILVIAFILRFYQLGSNPPALTWDEVSWGYNAYSLGLDGTDEYGRFLPYNYLESFGDFKPPVYAYLTVVPVLILGMTELATRFPSALFGMISVVFTYFLVKEIFFTSKNRKYYAIIACALMAISPWNIMLSRAAFEANVASSFIIIASYFFLRGIRESSKWFLLSPVFFVAAMYTFNSARIAVPLLVLILSIGSYKALLKNRKQSILAVIIGAALFLPIFGYLLSPQASLRFKEVNIFSSTLVIDTANQEIANNDNAWWSSIMHNRRVGFALSYIEHFTDNLNFNFLFVNGDGNIKFSTQDVGMMYLWEFPFVIAGLLFLFKKKEGKWWLVPLWIIAALVPAGVARETPHALRIENSLPMFQILSAYGITQAILFIKGRRFEKAVYVAVGGVVLFFFAYFIHGYYVHYPRESSREWQYGYKEAIAYAKSRESEFDEIRITTELGRPHMYLLFYERISPEYFRKNSDIRRDAFGFVEIDRIGKYVFDDEKIHKLEGNKKILVIEVPSKLPNDVTIEKEFKYLNGEVSLAAYQFNK